MSKDFGRIMGDAAGKGVVDPQALRTLGYTLAPVPKDASPAEVLKRWTEINGGRMPSSHFADVLDPKNPKYNKDAVDKAYEKTWTLKAGSNPPVGYLLKQKGGDHAVEVVLDQPGLVVKPKSPSLVQFGDGKPIDLDIQVSAAMLQFRAVGKDTVIDLTDYRPRQPGESGPEDLHININTAQGVPKIILPPDHRHVFIHVEGAEKVRIVEAAKAGREFKPAPLEIYGDAGLLKDVKADARNSDKDTEGEALIRMGTRERRTGIFLQPVTPILPDLEKSVDGVTVQLFGTMPGKKPIMTELGTIKYPGGEGRAWLDMLVGESLQKKLQLVPEQIRAQPEAKGMTP